MANEKRLIDANGVISPLQALLDKNQHHKDTYSYKAFEIVLQRLQDAPTVDAVEVVHAEWLDGYGVCDNKKSYISIDCSNCGEYFKIPGADEDIEEWKKRFAYCPFCGAKMDGDGNG